MRILMLGWELPPYNSGGLGVACYQLCKSLSEKGADLDFILPYSAEHAGIDFMRVTAAHPRRIDSAINFAGVYDSRSHMDISSLQHEYTQGVAQLIRNRGKVFDIIHAHDWLTFRAALRAKQYLGCPLILHIHSTESDRAGGKLGNTMVREIESMALTIADQVIAVSQHTKDTIVGDYDIPPEKIEVIHNSIDPGMLEPVDEANAYSYLTALRTQGYRVVVNVGRLTIQKGLPHLLMAAKEVIAHAPKTMFLIVGSGEQYFELIKLAADLGIAKNILFVSFQRGKRWRDAFAIADVFVMPSISEPFGLTTLEAVGFGTPVIISRQSGVAEVLRNSLKVNFWDVKELANKITAVVQNDVLRDELHANLLREYEKLSWDKSATRLFNVLDRTVRGTANANI